MQVNAARAESRFSGRRSVLEGGPEMCPQQGLAPRDLLSLREGEIAELVARGFSNKQIALDLRISPWTVSTHLRRVFAKLDIKSRVDLCRLVVSADRALGR